VIQFAPSNLALAMRKQQDKASAISIPGDTQAQFRRLHQDMMILDSILPTGIPSMPVAWLASL
jgi:hypothetical protein